MAKRIDARKEVAQVREANAELREENSRLNAELRRVAASDWATRGRAAIAEAAKLQQENELLVAKVNQVTALEAAGAAGGTVWAALRIGSDGGPMVELFSSIVGALEFAGKVATDNLLPFHLRGVRIEEVEIEFTEEVGNDG